MNEIYYKNKTFTCLVIIFLMLFVYSGSTAQKTAYYQDDHQLYRSAMELYDKEKYGAAREKFSQMIENARDGESEHVVNAEYYAAICAIELFNDDAEMLLEKFIRRHPESPKTKFAYFQMGKYKFRKHRYKDAIKWFEDVDIYELNNRELAEYYFKLGYSYFREDDYENAGQAFYEIKDVDTRYTGGARYYYGHIAYEQGKYETAYQTFVKVQKDEKFGPIAPYYITQILYYQEKYEELLEYAPPLLDSAIAKRSDEIARLIGDAYYRLDEYEKAIPYLEQYRKSVYSLPRQDYYQLGYAYLRTDQCEKAVDYLKRAVDGADSLTQTAHYHMGECHMKLEDKKYARSAFQSASEIDADEKIKENALFNYAKLCYELSYHPYNDAIIAFEKYINAYPGSPKVEEAYEYLVGVYYTTRNYKAALQSLQNIKKKGIKLKEAYQRIAYYRGVELFNDNNYNKAIELFEESEQYPFDKRLTALSTYWKGESYYRLKKYSEAIDLYEKFLFMPGAISMKQYTIVQYNMGYAHFKQNQYEEAAGWFRKYVDENDAEKSKRRADALIRIGDCYFVDKKYHTAVEYYDKAVMMGVLDVDYAIFQSAIANGVIGEYNEKANLLYTLVESYPSSNFVDNALYELGSAYLTLNNNKKALQYLSRVVEEYPNSSLVKNAYLKTGLVHYNRKEDEKALEAFDHVVMNYPSSSEAKEALEKIKQIYIDQSDLQAYEAYVKDIPFSDPSAGIADEDYYQVAENSYMQGDCEKAVKDFSRYLERYPGGNAALNAHFYRGECEYKSGFTNEALKDFKYVIDRPRSKFTEKSLLRLAVINSGLEKYEAAIQYYKKLENVAEIQAHVIEAQNGLMRIYYDQQDYANASIYAEKLVEKDKVEPQLKQDARLLLAKSLLATDKDNDALLQFEKLSKLNNRAGAEAKYNVANILYLKGDYAESEKTIFELVNQVPSYSHWIAKGFILLSDIYVAREDYFQAKYTLNSVIDNYEGEDIKSIAREKLKIIEGAESKEGEQEEKEDTLEINMGGEEGKGLFDNGGDRSSDTTKTKEKNN